MISKAKANVVVISQWEHPELGELIHALRVANIEISAIVFAGVIVWEIKKSIEHDARMEKLEKKYNC